MEISRVRLKCNYCKKSSYFYVIYKVLENGKVAYLTQCPHCSKYDDVKILNEITLDNLDSDEG